MIEHEEKMQNAGRWCRKKGDGAVCRENADADAEADEGSWEEYVGWGTQIRMRMQDRRKNMEDEDNNMDEDDVDELEETTRDD